MKKYTFFVKGTHCNSCKILIESIISEEECIDSIRVDLGAKTAEITINNEMSAEEILGKFNPTLAEHKYKLLVEKESATNEKFLSSIIFGTGILFLFFLLQKSGIIDFGFSGGVNFKTSFLIGVIASLSSCLAVVGGLILSLSAKLSQNAKSFRVFGLFHSGRVVGFALLGGVLGSLGEALSINYKAGAILGIIASTVMIILGVNLLGIFQNSSKFQLSFSGGFFKKIAKIESGFMAPFLVGAGTFFLPCGFTQSMQIASISSGSFYEGFMIMLFFSLGTLPMLFALSFSSYKFAHSKNAEVFYKTSGIVVIGLGIISLLSGLAGMGLIKPILNF